MRALTLDICPVQRVGSLPGTVPVSKKQSSDPASNPGDVRNGQKWEWKAKTEWKWELGVEANRSPPHLASLKSSCGSQPSWGRAEDNFKSKFRFYKGVESVISELQLRVLWKGPSALLPLGRAQRRHDTAPHFTSGQGKNYSLQLIKKRQWKRWNNFALRLYLENCSVQDTENRMFSEMCIKKRRK